MHRDGAVSGFGLNLEHFLEYSTAEIPPLDIFYPLVLLLLPWLLGEFTVLAPQGLFPAPIRVLKGLLFARPVGQALSSVLIKPGASQLSYSRFLLCGKPRRAKKTSLSSVDTSSLAHVGSGVQSSRSKSTAIRVIQLTRPRL